MEMKMKKITDSLEIGHQNIHVGDVGGMPFPFFRLEGFINTYEIYGMSKSGKTAMVRVSKNNEDAGNWGDKPKKIRKRYSTEEMKRDWMLSQWKKVVIEENQLSKIMKSYCHEKILETIPKKM